jgi:protein TonB
MRLLQFSAIVALFALATPSVHAAPWPEPKSDWGGAKPLNMDKWYSFEEYPESALRTGEQGMVVIGFTIDVTGRLADCHVIQSSKYEDLDTIPCRVLGKRARFEPASDSEGKPRPTTGTTAMSFWTP